MALESDGTWTAIDDGGGIVGGTYVPVGATGRTFDLVFDGPSLVFFRTIASGSPGGSFLDG